MYGPEGTIASTSKEQAQSNIADSDAKRIVDVWYKENIVDTGYGTNVSDEIFCNDRSIPGKDVSGYDSDTGLGYGSNHTAYGAYARLYNGGKNSINYNDPKPQFTCQQQNDAFTVEDTAKGNGALTYPVGLITADEIMTAGSGKFNTNNTKYYLFKSNNYLLWSFSPSDYNYDKTFLFMVNNNGYLGTPSTSNASGAAAPVINLSAKYVNLMIGTGTITDPYRAKEV